MNFYQFCLVSYIVLTFLFGLYVLYLNSALVLVRQSYTTLSKLMERGRAFQNHTVSVPADVYHSPSNEKLSRGMAFPQLPASATWSSLINIKGLRRTRAVRKLTAVMQEELDHFQTHASCTSYTLNCGNSTPCGLGCQIHHRATCLLMSYTMGIPLIHDTSAWPHDTPWEGVYRKLGSNCQVNEMTIYVTWQAIVNAPPILSLDPNCNTSKSCSLNLRFEFPLMDGVPIPKGLFRTLQAINHQDPFLWYVGQFMKYASRLSPNMERIVNDSAARMRFRDAVPIVGIHVRRTDKAREYSQSIHHIREYMNSVTNYFLKAHNKVKSISRVVSVYAASDDHKMLTHLRKKYRKPHWNILGMGVSQTFVLQKHRRVDSALKSIVQDVHFLSSCEHVVCGLTSNVCRLILELLATKYPDVTNRVTALDGNYEYDILGRKPPKRLIPF